MMIAPPAVSEIAPEVAAPAAVVIVAPELTVIAPLVAVAVMPTPAVERLIASVKRMLLLACSTTFAPAALIVAGAILLHAAPPKLAQVVKSASAN